MNLCGRLAIVALSTTFFTQIQAFGSDGGGGEVGNGGDGLPYFFERAKAELSERLGGIEQTLLEQQASPTTAQFFKDNKAQLIAVTQATHLIWQNLPERSECLIGTNESEKSIQLNLSGCRNREFEDSVQSILSAELTFFHKTETECFLIGKEIFAAISGNIQNALVNCYPDYGTGMYRTVLARDKNGNINLFWLAKGFYKSDVLGYSFGGITVSDAHGIFGADGKRYSFKQSDLSNFTGYLDVSTFAINSSGLVRALLHVDSCQTANCSAAVGTDISLICSIQ